MTAARVRRRRGARGPLVLGAALWVAGGMASVPEAEGARRRRAGTTAARRAPAASTRTAQASAVAGGGVVLPRAAPGVGRVLFVTDQRAYLDRGSRDGLKAKQAVQLLRAGRAIASCTVEEVADGQATCTGARPRAGDTFRVKPVAPDPKRAAVAKLAPVTPAATLERRAQQFEQASQELVDFKGVHLFGGHTRVQVSPAMAFWRTQSDPQTTYAVEQLDASIRGYDLGGTGLSIDAAFTAMRWSAGGGWAEVSRFRPGAATQFYLWQAELSRRQDVGGTVFAVGRIWPWHVPGVTLLDGFQLGRRNQGGTAEGGVYAGFVPSALSVAPSLDAWGAGLYGTLTEVGSARGLFRLARQQARVGVWRGLGGAGAPWVAEAEATGQVWLGPTSLAGGGRLKSGGATGSQPVLERVFFDFFVRPTAAVGGGVHVRYFGISPGAAELVGQVPATRGSVHALGDLHATPWSWLGVAAFVGLNGERESGRRQTHGAGEVRLPRLVGPYAGLAVGAEAQEGWLRARVLYGDVVGRPGRGVLAWARLSASATQFPAPNATPELHELGGQLRVDGPITSWVRAQGWCAVRVPWLIRGEPPPVPSRGLTAGISLRGVF